MKGAYSNLCQNWMQTTTTIIKTLSSQIYFYMPQKSLENHTTQLYLNKLKWMNELSKHQQVCPYSGLHFMFHIRYWFIPEMFSKHVEDVQITSDKSMHIITIYIKVRMLRHSEWKWRGPYFCTSITPLHWLVQVDQIWSCCCALQAAATRPLSLTEADWGRLIKPWAAALFWGPQKCTAQHK